MGDVVRFMSKSELERARLIREARANYERIFPSADPAREHPDPLGGQGSRGASDS